MKDQKKTRIAVRNLTKEFRIPHEKHSSLKSTILNIHKKKTYEQFQVLNDISFSVEDGDFFGIVGRNGSGKSTLLKLLAEIYSPTRGSIKINGNLTPFIELGVGFNPELSGKENVFLNAAILGLSESEIAEKYDSIVEFSELGRFMDQKLKNYSSGMQVRLAFAIAIQAHNDILLIDEVLAVGDAKFQRKCFNVFKQIKKSGKTVVLVTHDMGAVKEYCNKAMLLDKGKIRAIGNINEVTAAYNRINFEEEIDGSNKQKSDSKNNKPEADKRITIQNVKVFSNNKETNYLAPNESIELRIGIKCHKKTKGLLVGYSIFDSEDRLVFGSNSKDHSLKFTGLNPGKLLTINSQFINLLGNGTYTISVAVKSEDRFVLYDQKDKVRVIEVAGWQQAQALVHIENTMQIVEAS